MNNSKTVSDYKAMARQQLLGKYDMAVAISFLMAAVQLIVFLITQFSKSSFVPVALSFIEVALLTGSSFFFLNIARGRDYNLSDLMVMFRPTMGLSKLAGLLAGTIVISIISSLPMAPGLVCIGYASITGANSLLMVSIGTLLLLVGIIGSVYVSLTFTFFPYVVLDFSERPVTFIKLMQKSASLMKGQRFRVFYLYASYIGWFILGFLTCCLGLLWVEPYFKTALSNFYEDITRQPLSQPEDQETPQMQDTVDNPF